MNLITKAYLASLAIIALSFAISLNIADKLPETIAVHFDAAGEPNGYASKTSALYELPAVIIAVFSIMVLIFKARLNNPKYSEESKKREGVTSIIMILTAIFVGIAHYLMINQSLHPEESFNTVFVPIFAVYIIAVVAITINFRKKNR